MAEDAEKQMSVPDPEPQAQTIVPREAEPAAKTEADKKAAADKVTQEAGEKLDAQAKTTGEAQVAEAAKERAADPEFEQKFSVFKQTGAGNMLKTALSWMTPKLEGETPQQLEVRIDGLMKQAYAGVGIFGFALFCIGEIPKEKYPYYQMIEKVPHGKEMVENMQKMFKDMGISTLETKELDKDAFAKLFEKNEETSVNHLIKEEVTVPAGKKITVETFVVTEGDWQMNASTNFKKGERAEKVLFMPGTKIPKGAMLAGKVKIEDVA